MQVFSPIHSLAGLFRSLTANALVAMTVALCGFAGQTLASSADGSSGSSVTFHYADEAENDEVVIYLRAVRRYITAPAEDGFSTAPDVTTAIARYGSVQKREDGALVTDITVNRQNVRRGSNPESETMDPFYPVRTGRYRIEGTDTDDKALRYLEKGADGTFVEADLPEDEAAKALAFLGGAPFYERFGHYLDDKTFQVGEAVDPGPTFNDVLGDNTTWRTLTLEDVGTRWGREIARFSIEAGAEGSVPLSVRWMANVDVETGRTVSFSREITSDKPSSIKQGDGSDTFLHVAWQFDTQYRHSLVPVDRSTVEVVNPAFMAPGGDRLADIAFVPSSGSLILLEQAAPGVSGKSRQTLGIWNVRSQKVTKVIHSDFGGRIFGSSTAPLLLQADDDLSIKGFMIQKDGFEGFGHFLRFSTEQDFTAMDVLGVYAAVGTNLGEIGFVNAGHDEEMGLYDVSTEPVIAVSVSASAKRIASVDRAGVLRVDMLDFPDRCGRGDFLSAYCGGGRISLGPRVAEKPLGASQCLEVSARSLRMSPDGALLAWAEPGVGPDCRAGGRIIIEALDTGIRRMVRGTVFAFSKDSARLVTEAGVYELGVADPQAEAFDHAIEGARKLVVADDAALAFVLGGDDSVFMVDLKTRSVLGDLVSEAGYEDVSAILGRAIIDNRLWSVTANGIVIAEEPETNRTEYQDVLALAGAKAGGARLTDAEIRRQGQQIILAYTVSGPGGERTHLARMTRRGWRHLGDFETSKLPLARALVVAEGQVFLLAGDGLAVLDDEGLVVSRLPEDTGAAEVTDLKAGRGPWKGRPIFVRNTDPGGYLQSVSLAIGHLDGDAVTVEKSFPLHEPDRWNFTSDTPLAISPDGRYAAVANMRAPDNGKWSENVSLIFIMDLANGARIAEIFPGWAGNVTALAFDATGRTLGIGTDSGRVVLEDLRTGAVRQSFQAHDAAVASLSWDGTGLVTRGREGVIRMWDAADIDLDYATPDYEDRFYDIAFGTPGNDQMVAAIFDPLYGARSKRFEGSVVLTSDGYYAGDKNRLRRLSFIDSWGGSVDLLEADIFRNRPDIALSRAGLITPDRQLLLARLHEKRLLETGSGGRAPTMTLSAAAELNVVQKTDAITGSDAAEFALSSAGQAGLRKVELLNNGIVLDRLSVSGGSNGETINVPLEPGLNRIRFTDTDTRGSERTLFRTTIRRAAPEDIAPPKLYVFAVGVSDYSDNALDLTYAAKDARDIGAYFGEKANAIVHVSTDGAATADLVGEARRFFSQARPQDKTLFFFAGHGLLDDDYGYYLGSHETDVNDLADTAISFKRLESIFDDTDSLHRVMLIDACHSGVIDPSLKTDERVAFASGAVVARDARGAVPLARRKNTVSLEDSYEVLRANFLDTKSRSGANIISASGGFQFAFENPEVANGLFTHVLLDGLRTRKADSNGDDAVELSELFRYVSANVLELSGGRQMPSVRSEPQYSQFTLQ
ncbi:MAG: hypothetical protein CL534_24460 [Ahrensia sp.]|nr:hypothetical protein [Ahrensia sp.]